MKKLLLHACCGPCSIHVAKELQKDYEVGLFYCESNIFPLQEYSKRLEELRKVSKFHGVNLYISNYDHETWAKAIKGLEDEPEGGKRCVECFRERLKETAKAAKDMKYDLFATTLTVSPHKDAQKINELGNVIAENIDINYLESDFKKNDGFKKSAILTQEHRLYRQDYCGCEFSRN